MKMNVKIAAIAVAVMGLTVACNHKTEAVEDTVAPIDSTIEAVVDSVVDSIIEEVSEEIAQPVKKAAATTKKAVEKKATQEIRIANNNAANAAQSEEAKLSKVSKVSAQNKKITATEGNNQNVASEQSTQNKLKKVAAKQ